MKKDSAPLPSTYFSVQKHDNVTNTFATASRPFRIQSELFTTQTHFESSNSVLSKMREDAVGRLLVQQPAGFARIIHILKFARIN